MIYFDALFLIMNYLMSTENCLLEVSAGRLQIVSSIFIIC